MKILIAFSGGKDSLACLIWAVKKYGLKNCEAVFCDTGWESEITYKHIDEVIEKMKIEFIVLKSAKYNGFVDLAKQKKRFPSAKARFCTEELKSKPMIDYILTQKDHLIIIQGIRKDESKARSSMNGHCNYFKYYYEHYGIDKKGKKKFHTYRKKDVLKWRAEYSDEVLRPAIDWTANEVMQYILSNGYKPNPLYYKGFSRVGCFPCIMCRHNEIKQIAKQFPEDIQKIRNAEEETKRTFFSPGTIPERFMSLTDKKTNKKIPSVDDVVKYVSDDEFQENIFEDEGDSCMSVYNICE